MSKPPWVHYSLTPQWLAATRELTQSLDARLILGINFEADSDVLARTEASALMRGVGPRSVVALELGNEPELYHSFGWYRGPNGQEVTGRPADYDFDMFEREFTSVASALPGVPVAGPTTGGPWWEPDWARFLAAEPSVKLATLHRYPLHACSRRSSSLYPTIDHLVDWPASAGLAASSERLVRVAHAHGVPLRIDEMNVTPCPQRAHEVRSFAGALWALDVLFEMRAAGVDGVNVQSTTGGTEDLFAFARLNGRWQGLVEPEYYGLLMFAQAAPPGSQLVSLSRSTRGSLHTWATRARDGTVRVVVINDGAAPRKVALRAPAARGSATLERLLAPSIASKQGITLGGQTFGSVTTTGRLAGHRKTDRVSLRAGRYVFSMPAYSAAMLTLG